METVLTDRRTPAGAHEVESVLSHAVMMSEFPISITSAPHTMATELQEAAAAAAPYMNAVDGAPARLLLAMRCLYLLGVQRGCELLYASQAGSIGSGLRPFELRDCGGYVDGMTADLACICQERLCALLAPFGITFTEKGEVSNV